MKAKLQTIASEMKKITGRDCAAKRCAAFEDYCRRYKIAFVYAGDKPHGRACEVVDMRDKYRVFVRCGYGKYNYAPCYEVAK